MTDTRTEAAARIVDGRSGTSPEEVREVAAGAAPAGAGRRSDEGGWWWRRGAVAAAARRREGRGKERRGGSREREPARGEGRGDRAKGYPARHYSNGIPPCGAPLVVFFLIAMAHPPLVRH